MPSLNVFNMAESRFYALAHPVSIQWLIRVNLCEFTFQVSSRLFRPPHSILAFSEPCNIFVDVGLCDLTDIFDRRGDESVEQLGLDDGINYAGGYLAAGARIR